MVRYFLLVLGFALAVVGGVAPSFAETDAAELPAGLELKNPRQPASGLVTGGQPTAADLALLQKQGISTVINLRTPGEVSRHDDPAVAARLNFDEAAAAAGLGLDYISFPISGRDGLTEANARRLDALLAASGGKVLLHCGSGNRVGALMALRAYYVGGQTPDDALAAGLAAGLTSLEPKVRQILGMPMPEGGQ